MGEGECVAWEALQHCIANAGDGVAATSWSHFDQDQLAAALQHHGGGGGAAATAGVDWKSQLNIFLQHRDRPVGFGQRVCMYAARSSGPPHAPSFRATVTISGVVFDGEAQATKKGSEQMAAYVALGSLSLDATSLGVDPAAVPAWVFELGGTAAMSDMD